MRNQANIYLDGIMKAWNSNTMACDWEFEANKKNMGWYGLHTSPLGMYLVVCCDHMFY